MPEQKPYIGSPENPRTTAFVCYISILGWLIAYYWLYPYHKDSTLARLHLQQSLFLHLFTFLINALLYFLIASWVVYGIVVGLLFLLWLAGVLNAVNGKERLLPVIGDWTRKLFGRL